MKIVKAASGNKLRITEAEWQAIGKKSGWSKHAASSDVYTLEKDEKTGKMNIYYGGFGEDNEGEEVFDMKMLLKTYDVFKEMNIAALPEYKKASEWNKFLEILENRSGIKFGRVEDTNAENEEIKKKFRGNILPDTQKQKKEEDMKRRQREQELFNRGIFDSKIIDNPSAKPKKNDAFIPNQNDPRDVRRFM